MPVIFYRILITENASNCLIAVYNSLSDGCLQEADSVFKAGMAIGQMNADNFGK
jgi:hypothetical protein